MIAAVSRGVRDLIIAPMLKIAIPEEVWSSHLCLIVPPGIKGDRGPSSLDWSIVNGEKVWGVTILEAAEFDAGPIWASHQFSLELRKNSSAHQGSATGHGWMKAQRHLCAAKSASGAGTAALRHERRRSLFQSDPPQ